jgi:hypothetical protein
MPQPTPLELAKQGDVKAIACLINRSLKAKEIKAQVNLKDGCLLVVLESATIPNKQVLSQFVLNGISKLGVDSIYKLRIYGRLVGGTKSAWSQEFTLKEQEKPEVLEPKGSSKYLIEKDPLMPFWIAGAVCINLFVALLLFFAFKPAPKVASVPNPAPTPIEVSPSPEVEPSLNATQQEIADDLDLKVAALNAEFAAYRSLVTARKLNLSQDQLIQLAGAEIKRVASNYPEKIRDEAKKTAIVEFLAMIKGSQQQSATETGERVLARYNQAVQDYGILITEKPY